MIRRRLPSLLLLVALLAGWQLYCVLSGVNSLVLPTPSAIAASLFNDAPLLWSNFLVTAGEVAGGMAIATAAAVLLAVAIHSWAFVRSAVYPLLVLSQTVPFMILTPILIVWLGFSLVPKLLVVALVCFFPIAVALLDGLAAVDPDLPKLMRTLGASRGQILLRVEAPNALPQLFSGLRIAVTLSVTAAVLAETLGGSSAGLGYLMRQSSAQYEMARAFAAAVPLAAFAILLFLLVNVLQRRLLPWAPR